MSLGQIIAASSPLILALMGLWITLRPPAMEWQWHWFAVFAVVGLAGTAASLWENYQSHTAQTKSVETQEAIRGGVAKLLLGQKVDRVLSPEDRAKILQFLKPHVPNRVKVTVTCLAGDAEGCRYGEQWATAIREAGWTIGGTNSAIVAGAPPVGVSIRVKNQEIAGAAALQRAFSLTGVEAAGILVESNSPDNIDLFIGGRP